MNNLFGIKIVVSPDTPKMQLVDGSRLMAGDYVTPQCRAETNAWLLAFFGTTNMLKDGESLLSEITHTVWMNPRTFTTLKSATPQGKL